MIKSISFSNLEITIVESNEYASYTFVGDVDENFRQTDVPRIKRPKIIMELEGVNAFNSVGIREWIHFMSDMCKMGTLVFYKCSVSTIDQFNMIPESTGNGTVETFYAPYYCSCGEEVNKLIETKSCIKQLAESKAPDFQCEKCGRILEFDALEESYFQFVHNTAQVS